MLIEECSVLNAGVAVEIKVLLDGSLLKCLALTDGVC